MKIAILGATSQIAKDLVLAFSKQDSKDLIIFRVAANALFLCNFMQPVSDEFWCDLGIFISFSTQKVWSHTRSCSSIFNQVDILRGTDVA